jgi:hypothetical protein
MIRNLDKIQINLDKFTTPQKLDKFSNNLDKFGTPLFTDAAELRQDYGPTTRKRR